MSQSSNKGPQASKLTGQFILQTGRRFRRASRGREDDLSDARGRSLGWGVRAVCVCVCDLQLFARPAGNLVRLATLLACAALDRPNRAARKRLANSGQHLARPRRPSEKSARTAPTRAAANSSVPANCFAAHLSARRSEVSADVTRTRSLSGRARDPGGSCARVLPLRRAPDNGRSWAARACHLAPSSFASPLLLPLFLLLLLLPFLLLRRRRQPASQPRAASGTRQTQNGEQTCHLIF